MKAEILNVPHDDVLVLNAARVSFGKHTDWQFCTAAERAECPSCGAPGCEGYLKEADDKLLHFLARHRHWSPFAHPQMVVQYRMTEPDMLRWLLGRNPAGFRTYRCEPDGDEYMEKGSLYAWAANLGFLPPPIGAGVADMLYDLFPYSAEALSVPTDLARHDHVRLVPMASLTDKWMAKDLRRAVLSSATAHLRAPFPVRTQLMKHTFGFAWNEISRRYVDAVPEVYVPPVWRGKPLDKKQGSSETEVTELRHAPGREDRWNEVGNRWSPTRHAKTSIDQALAAYRLFVESGVAPEQARFLLPGASMTEWYWTGSIADFARVARLRLKPDSQDETRTLVEYLAAQLQTLYPLTWRALVAPEGALQAA